MTEEEKEQYIHNIQQLEKEKKWKAIAAILKELNEMDAAELIKNSFRTILSMILMFCLVHLLPQNIMLQKLYSII